MLMCAFTLKHLTASTLELLYEVFRWSFECLACGRFPDSDHKGRAWQARDAERATNAGKLLAPLPENPSVGLTALV
eukprot:13241252-Alexandrium_andersonii.AAC.1